MSRGSRNLAEPVTMVHLETKAERLAVTKADHVNLTAAGYREPETEGTATPPADAAVAEAEATEQTDKRKAAAQKAAKTRRQNAAKAAAESGETADAATAPETPDPTPVGSVDADATSV
jgi:hypothetical protein